MKLRPGVARQSWGDFVMMDMIVEFADYERTVGTHAVRSIVIM